jgi:hypothetical protein
MSVSRTLGFEGDGQVPARVPGPPHPAVVTAVKEDIRQTLRSPWIDPALELASEYPIFFTAAWSAVRPNIGRSFLTLARSVRAEAAEAVRAMVPGVDLRKGLEGSLSDEELRRAEDCARAAHLGASKAQIVTHALYRAARRERIPGTGGEEPPTRRGVPEWQRWMSTQPTSGPVATSLESAATSLALPAPPVPMRLLAMWPEALESLWGELRTRWGSDEWNLASARIRRLVLAGVSTLPHPVELQWGALIAKGFTEEQRGELVEGLAAFDAAMPGLTLVAAFAWSTMGAPDVGAEG